ncbi:MAG: tRNA (guanosine(46)-N7)-methyltransferase TrmB [Planctomycetota bacterium]
MPRAALRRPPAELDLSQHLLDVDHLPALVTSTTLFENSLPLEIEVGSGKGLFIQNESERHPDVNYLGIEVARKYATHAAARLARRGRENARMASGDAGKAFDPEQGDSQIPEASLAGVHVYFPDPWWKKRHRKRRVLSRENILHFARAIKLGGKLHFWTDVLDYFEQTVELIAEVAPELGVPVPQVQRDAEHDLDYHTHFERRSRKLAIPVYRVAYTKRRLTSQ